MSSLKVLNTNFKATLTPTLDTDAYSQYDVLGGAQTISDLPACIWRHLKVVDKAAQAAGMRLWFFRADPAIADDAAFSPTDAELDDLAVKYTVNSSDFITPTGGANAVAFVTPNLDIVTPGDYYVYIETTGTPTYAATSLTLEFTFWNNKAG